MKGTGWSIGTTILGACVLWGAVATADVSPAVREYRLRMFDPAVSTLANRSIELMFDTRTVRAGSRPWKLPVSSRQLDFQYEAAGVKVPADQIIGAVSW